VRDPDFVNIGFRSLIDRRSVRAVPVEPGGYLPDYVPFFFCNRPVMLYPIAKNHVPDYTGKQHEIIYLISSAEIVSQSGLQFVFSDRHALLEYARFSNKPEDLAGLDWQKIKTANWGIMHDETRQTMEVKQAEFLVYKHMLAHCVKAVVCANQTVFNFVQPLIAKSNININLSIKPQYYY
jgi:hypothetical protein